MKLWLVCAFLLAVNLANPASAQYKPYKFKENQKQWEDGRLTWSDFRGKPLNFAGFGSELIFVPFYKAEKTTGRDTTVFKIRAIIFMDRDQSWVVDSVRTPHQLKLNQAYFNTIELHERKLEQRLNLLSHVNQGPDILLDQIRQLREDLFRINSQTKGGKDEKLTDSWLAQSYQKLDSIGSPWLPAFRLSDFGLGLHFAASYFTLAGDLGKAFSNTPGFGLGFDYGFKKAFLLLDGFVGFGKASETYNGKYMWPVGTNLISNQISATFGYAIIDNAKLRISPFVGPAFVNVSLATSKNSDEKEKGQSLSDGTAQIGVNIDWKLRHQLSMLPVLFGREFVDLGIRTRFSYCPANLENEAKGSMYNASLSFYMHGRFVKLKAQ